MPPDLCALVCVYFCKILSYVWICMTHHSQDTEQQFHHGVPHATLITTSPSTTQSLATSNRFSIPIVLLSQESYINAIGQYVIS